MAAADQQPPQPYRPGDVVSTAYGVGVIVGHGSNNSSEKDPLEDGSNNDSFFSVRLWRKPGASVSSASLGYLRPSTFRGRLPAAPGMTTTLLPSLPKESSSSSTVSADPDDSKPKKPQQVLVHCYYGDRQTFLVSLLPDEDDAGAGEGGGGGLDGAANGESGLPLASRRLSSAAIRLSASFSSSPDKNKSNHSNSNKRVEVEYLEVDASLLALAPAAKFYPVLETLMVRGEQTAAAAAHLLEDDTTRRLVDSTGKALAHRVDALSSTVASTTRDQQVVPGSLDELEDWTTTVAAPQAEAGLQQVLKLVKDEELTVLLETCRERLQQLVQTDLTETTRKALEKTGIRIETDYSVPASFAESMEVSRKTALAAVEKLLAEAQVDPAALEKVRSDVSSHFCHAFDSLSAAAKSDRSLNAVFESLAEKTTEWQQLTGRLLQTRSASLFLEGATRLQARAAAILQQGQLQWAGEVGSMLTKSFTEGDAALARLKTIEFGDAVKNRLVDAIEVRSESLGGLDGIIAGALTTVKAKASTSGSAAGTADQMRDLLTGLQQKASTVTVDAHETLISLLSSRSTYRDVALLRIESVLCMLENQFGDSLSPEEIAAIASGEGGTAKIFEPIAKRAMEQIENQLDLAESKVSDATVLGVLKRVRKIMSGELTLSNVMDEVVSILNDDSVVKAGESLIQQSEHVLDVIEGASGNRAVNDAIKMVEKAGITKDTIMQEIEQMDVNDLLDTAGSAVTDERARRKLLSKATDTALDFVLKILPSMPVPPFEGVKDGLLYHISNLSMAGFKVRKEDIQIELAGMRATRRASSVLIESMPSQDSLEGSTHSYESTGSALEVEEVHAKVKATELLIIDIRNISAVLNNAAWSFEQTYMPYLKGGGLADVKLSGGSIRLQFELRKWRKEGKEGEKPVWEPVLCLHDRTCLIENVGLTLQGEGRLTWILNKLASIFKGPLRDYVVRTIVNVLTTRSGWILGRLNVLLAPYWDLILRTAGLSMDDLVKADEKVVVKESVPEDRNCVELVWRERLPLGMNLLMNDDSGFLKVVDFPRGSPARNVCEKRGFDPDVFKGSTIVAVNGFEYDDQDDLFDALKDPSRPKTVQFALADSVDAERVRRFVEGKNSRQNSADEDEDSVESEREFKLRDVVLDEPGEVGIEFGNSFDNFGLVVRGFMEGPGGTVLSAERSGKIAVGDLLVKINGKLVVSTDGSGRSHAVELLESAAAVRPLSLTFADPYLHSEIIESPPGTTDFGSDGGPNELLLDEQTSEEGLKRIVLKGFDDISGKAESSGILIGDHLVFLNGLPVGAGCRWLGVSPSPTLTEVNEMLENETSYPMGLTFARPRQQVEGSGRWSPVRQQRAISDDEADTTCVTVDACGQLGCVLEQTRNADIQVVDFESVPGVFQLALAEHKNPNGGRVCLSVDSLNGQFVPSYATRDMVKNAITRSWKSDGRVEMWLCDVRQKRWIHQIATS